ncbi:putative dual-specificity RNA methyltransferase RlmN [Trichinella pseudospiralis]
MLAGLFPYSANGHTVVVSTFGIAPPMRSPAEDSFVINNAYLLLGKKFCIVASQPKLIADTMKTNDQCTEAEGKNELYHEEDATPTSVDLTRRHSFLLPQEASIDPASFQFNILSTGKVVAMLCH